MRYQDEAKSLFQLSTELTERKVEIAVTNATAEVVKEIIALRHELKQEMHELKQEMGSRLASVETALGFRNQSRGEVRTRLYDFAFKAGWIILCAAISYLAVRFHIPI